MNKKRLATIAISLLLVAGSAFAITYTLSSKSKTDVSDVSTPVSGVGGKEKPYEVELKNGNDKPVDLLINKGDYVQFNSKDGRDHQVIQGLATNTEHGDTAPDANEHSADAGSRPAADVLDSGIIKPDEGYLLQFNKIGKYAFHDNYDHAYTITVIVYDPSKNPKAQ